jgi:hypothetical protein
MGFVVALTIAWIGFEDLLAGRSQAGLFTLITQAVQTTTPELSSSP